jgi:uncharacterized protein DUF2336
MASQANSAEPNLARDLISLASEKSSAKRVELLRRITDAYLQVDAPVRAAAQYLFDELIVKLVEVISTHDRAQVSGHFSKSGEVPTVLAHRLATDQDIAVAAPMLQGYAALAEATLIAVATDGSQQHLRSIASRPLVSRSVTDVVVKRGDQTTVRTLAANQGAQFSSAGMRTLAQKSERDDVLQSLLVERPDLSLEAIGMLLPIVTPKLAERLNGRSVEIDPVVIGSHLANWIRQRTDNIARTDALIEAIRDEHLHLDDVLTDEIKRKHLFETVAILAAVIGVEAHYGFELLIGGTTEQALLLLRTVDLPWPTVKAFLKLKSEKTGHEAEPPRFEGYVAIDIAAARRVVRFLNLRRRVGAPTGPEPNRVDEDATLAAADPKPTHAIRLPK